MKIYSDYFIELKRPVIQHTHYLVTYEEGDIVYFIGCYKTLKKAKVVLNALWTGDYLSKKRGFYVDYILKPFAIVPLRGERYIIGGFYGTTDGVTTVVITKIDLKLINWPIEVKACENVRRLFPDFKMEFEDEESVRFDEFDEKYRLKMDYAN